MKDEVIPHVRRPMELVGNRISEGQQFRGDIREQADSPHKGIKKWLASAKMLPMLQSPQYHLMSNIFLLRVCCEAGDTAENAECLKAYRVRRPEYLSQVRDV